MERDQIIKMVLARMDELTPFGEGLAVSPDMENYKPIETYIDEFLDEAYLYLLKVIPPVHLAQDDIDGEWVLNDGVASIVLPASFIKIAKIKFPGWHRPVMTSITENHPAYLLQQNEYLRAGNAKPIVAVVSKDNTKHLECYTVTSLVGERVSKIILQKQVEEVSEKLLDCLSWYTASLVYTAIEKPENGKIAYTEFEKLVMIL